MTPDDLVLAVVEIREKDALTIVDELLDDGTDPATIIDSCREAMTTIGERFEAGEAFIPELIMAGELMSGISAKVQPRLKQGDTSRSIGCIIIGTVKGDIHDIGKDIVASLLDASGFEVVNLGVDVEPKRFVDEVREHGSCTVALSCLLTSGFDAMRATVAAIKEAGLRSQTQIMIGGAPITEDVCGYAGADGWGDDAATALRVASEWAKEVRCG
jgi:methanogenic corrinoid protein MtbC1